MAPLDEDKRRRKFREQQPRTTKMKNVNEEAAAVATSALPSSAKLLETRVSLEEDCSDFNRTKTSSLIWLLRRPKRLWRGGINLATGTRTTLISEPQATQMTTTKRKKSKSKKKRQREIKIETTEQAAVVASASGACKNSNPMISINVSEPTMNDDDDDDLEAKTNKEEDGEYEEGEGEEKGSDSLVCNVETVRHNFIRLINFNKFLYFYLATLIYAVINLGLIFYYLTDDGNAKRRTETSEEATNCHRHENQTNQIRLQTDANLYKLTKWFLMPPICTLVAVVIFITIEFNSRQVDQSKTGRIVYRYIQAIGQFAALLLLNLPFGLFILHQVTVSSFELSSGRLMVNDNDGQSDISPSDCTDDSGTIALQYLGESRLPLGALLASLYLEPFFIESRRLMLNAKIICLLQISGQMLSVFWFGWLAAANHDNIIGNVIYGQAAAAAAANGQPHPESHHTERPLQKVVPIWQSVMLACLVLLPVLIFSALRRFRFRRIICRDTFLGAGDLIEAKVSLEHQRQQQETLLLSVLPAYVAEQVKRNMLKKTNNGNEQLLLLNNNNNNNNNNNSLGLATSQPLAELPSQTAAAPNSALQRCPASSYLSASISGQPSDSSQITHSNSASLIQQQSLAAISPGKQRRSSLMKVESLAPGQAQRQQQQAEPKRSSQTTVNLPMAQVSSGNHGGGGGSGSITSGSPQLGGVRRGFNELYIRTYNNVSLLYGDIVGFTRLCTQLSSSQLVRVLNDLFSHFDHLAEKHKIMRIKILGDCYYGVSGIPEFAVMGAKSRALKSENHAINCVNMGLDMISYIKCLNVERSSSSQTKAEGQERPIISHSASGQVQTASAQLQHQRQSSLSSTGRRKSSSCSISGSKSVGDCTAQSVMQQQHQKNQDIQSPLPVFELNMRIGVHSGHIHSGVIGLKKWQFDVWSNDVSIAMRCESSGTAGRVQVTEATVQQLNGAFSYEEARASERDSFLATKGIKTFLIRDKIVKYGGDSSPFMSRLQNPTSGGDAANDEHPERVKRANRRQQQRQRLLQDSMEKAEKDLMLDEDKIRAATIGTIRQTLLAGESCNASGCNSIGLALDHNDLKPMGLNFRDPIIGKLYKNRLARSLAHESAAVLLLLIIVLPLIDHQLPLLNAPEDEQQQQQQEVEPTDNWPLLLVVSTFCALLLLIGIVWPHIRNQVRKVISGRSSVGRRQSKRNKSLRNRRRSTIQETANQVAITLTNDYHCVGPDNKRHYLPFAQVRSALHRYYRLLLRSKYNPIRSSSGTRTSKFRSKFCRHKTNKATENDDYDMSNNIKRLISIEPHHLAVIFILICLDSSVESIGFRSKSVLIFLLICMNILFTFKGSPWPHYYLMKQHFPNHTILCGLHSNQKQRQQVNQVLGHQRDELVGVQALIDWSTSGLVCLVALLSLAYARQLEYTNRANFLWRNRLGVDHEELEYISGINKVLLENILPSHVVEHYMSHPNEQPAAAAHQSNNGANQTKVTKLQNYMRMSFSNMRTSGNELYHEQHESVSVMFASIPHFYEFYDESDISKQGLGCIALLNEIICDFDKLLLKNKFSRIEKIKTIGSTYMAAAGLRPSYGGRNSTVSAQTLNFGQPPAALGLHQTESNTLTVNSAIHSIPAAVSEDTSSLQAAAAGRKPMMSQQKLNLICMIQFASSLMSALNGINKQSFQGFKLRVGVNSGSVIAGIIGAQRPFYDIWGDCVNIASRMDSLGETGRIQVEEKTAQLLMESLCTDTYSIVRRGPIEVKGKGGMVTYFVDKRDHQQQSAALIAACSSSADACEASASISGVNDRQADVQGLASTRSGSLAGKHSNAAGPGAQIGSGSNSELTAQDKQVAAPVDISGGEDVLSGPSVKLGNSQTRGNSLAFTC